MVEDDVSQQRGNDTALRGADRSGLEDALFHDPSAEEFLDEVENVAVGNLSCDCFHNDPLRQIIEKPLDVGIEDDPIAFGMEFQYFFEGLVAVASRAEAEGRVVKQQFKDGMEQSAKGLLRHSISNRGDTQRTELARLFGNILPS